MKLRQILVLSGLGAATLCIVLISMLIGMIGEVNEARDLQRQVRMVESEVDGVASRILEFGLGNLSLERFSQLVEAVERIEQSIAASEIVSEEFEESFAVFDMAIAEYTMALGQASTAEKLGGGSVEQSRRAMVEHQRELRAGADSLVEISDAEMDAAQDRVIRAAAVLLVLLVSLIIATAVRVTRRVLRPTRDLKAAIEEMDKGRWPLEIDVSINDELGELAETFNSMALRKKTTEQELQAMYEELEDRVEQRTHDLAQSNEALGLEIDERKRAEEQLRTSEERFRRIFEEGPIGIGVVSRENRFQTVNHALARILGLPAREVEGRELREFYKRGASELHFEEARAAFKAGAASYGVETWVARPDGESRRINLVAVVVRANHGGVEYGLVMVEDITERKRAEELLLENERFVATGRMAARIAHEINNPLAGIKNAFRLVKGAVPEDHEFAGYVPRIDREIDRVARIVRQMYELYKPPAASLDEFRVDEAVRDVVAMMTVGDRGDVASEIVVEVSEAGARVKLIEGLFRQVLYNLIQNAIEHSPSGTPVRVTVSVEGDELELLVADEGEGIAAENQSRVFDAFFTTKEGRQGSGLGLGLSITLRAVEALGGTVSFESEEGAGTAFRVQMPVVRSGLASAR